MQKESCKQDGKDQFNELLFIFSLKQQDDDQGHAGAKVREVYLGTSAQFYRWLILILGETKDPSACLPRLFRVWRDVQEEGWPPGTLFNSSLWFCLHQVHKQSCGQQLSHHCFECGKVFPTMHGVMIHQRFWGAFECLACKVSLTSTKELQSHINSVHRNV